jgi:hypothetical protein
MQKTNETSAKIEQLKIRSEPKKFRYLSKKNHLITQITIIKVKIITIQSITRSGLLNTEKN